MRIWHLTVPVKSHKVQLEAMHNSKHNDFERDSEGKTSMVERAFEGKRSMLEQCFRALSGLKARSSSDFERSVASKEKEACSSTDFERSVASTHLQRPLRRSKKQARAVISSAQWLWSTLEQWLRAHYAKTLRLCGVFECCRGSLEPSVSDSSGEFTI